MRKLGRRLFTAALAACAVSLAVGVPSRAAAQQATVTEISTEQLQKLLEGMGYEVEEPKEDVLRFGIEGHSALIINKKTNIQFYSFFKKKADVQKMNEWNRAKRFSRVYIDGDGDPVIEWDLDLEGGTTLGAVKESIRTYRLAVVTFAQFLNED
ncbi:MAG TPA: YbjN domain-containing protein [Gemmatimonadales bacterium]|nr:YbjN domain-containing protein [Gemmatimonadales bacterium]